MKIRVMDLTRYAEREFWKRSYEVDVAAKIDAPREVLTRNVRVWLASADKLVDGQEQRVLLKDDEDGQFVEITLALRFVQTATGLGFKCDVVRALTRGDLAELFNAAPRGLPT